MAMKKYDPSLNFSELQSQFSFMSRIQYKMKIGNR